ncbi:hypothetical protein HBB16_02490 [Pseudonocardia sp. MCCB 268]|nr:hypothetical protein [Pseudonocardia cytotoxica]
MHKGKDAGELRGLQANSEIAEFCAPRSTSRTRATDAGRPSPESAQSSLASDLPLGHDPPARVLPVHHQVAARRSPMPGHRVARWINEHGGKITNVYIQKLISGEGGGPPHLVPAVDRPVLRRRGGLLLRRGPPSTERGRASHHAARRQQRWNCTGSTVGLHRSSGSRPTA